jgi:dienelactone hydrolase
VRETLSRTYLCRKLCRKVCRSSSSNSAQPAAPLPGQDPNFSDRQVCDKVCDKDTPPNAELEGAPGRRQNAAAIMNSNSVAPVLARHKLISWFVLLAAALCGAASPVSAAEPAGSDQQKLPWDMGLLTTPPKWATLERPKANGLKAITFTGAPYQGKQTRVFAWLGIPKLAAGEKAPAMVLIHGGGGTAFEEWVRLWVDRGYAAIAMDTCGQLPVGNYGRWFRDEQGGPPGWGGFDQTHRAPEEQWTYHAVADAILAHSLIRALPEVDPDRTGVTGISWGGYLTCIVAGVDARFKLAVPVYGCGFYRNTVFAGELNKLTQEQAERWLSWWDPASYLARATMPFLWVTGSNDFAYPLDALQLSYRAASGSRALCVRLRMPHGHGGAGENPREIHVFADGILKRARGLPTVTASAREGTNVWATFSAESGITKAELNFTKADGRWQDRAWETAPARLTGNRVTAVLPEGTRVYYLNLFDDRECAVSTEHEVLP